MSKPKFPAGERVWVRYYDAEQKLMLIMTSKTHSRDYYYLYELVGGEFKKLGKSRSPVELEEKYKVSERIRKSAQ